jgi:hypothetical protein
VASVTITQKPPVKARFWVELRDVDGVSANSYDTINPDTGFPQDPDLWTDADGNETLGIAGMTPREASDLRDLFNVAPVWKPAGSRAEWAIINLTGAAVQPEPSWQNWSEPRKNTNASPLWIQTPTRPRAFRYVSLYGARRYAGRTDIFVDSVPLLSTAFYGGDATNVAAFGAQTLPFSQSPYAGNSASFPANVRLPDDGDIPS